MTLHQSIASPDEVERLVYHMKSIAGTGDAWSTGFARSILRNSKRPGWVPSEKQLSCMRNLVADLFANRSDDPEVIERG